MSKLLFNSVACLQVDCSYSYIWIFLWGLTVFRDIQLATSLIILSVIILYYVAISMNTSAGKFFNISNSEILEPKSIKILQSSKGKKAVVVISK